MPPYIQYGKELFASWSCHTHLTDLLDPEPSPINQLWDMPDLRVHDLYIVYPFPAATLPELEPKLSEQ